MKLLLPLLLIFCLPAFSEIRGGIGKSCDEFKKREINLGSTIVRTITNLFVTDFVTEYYGEAFGYSATIHYICENNKNTQQSILLSFSNEEEAKKVFFNLYYQIKEISGEPYMKPYILKKNFNTIKAKIHIPESIKYFSTWEKHNKNIALKLSKSLKGVENEWDIYIIQNILNG